MADKTPAHAAEVVAEQWRAVLGYGPDAIRPAMVEAAYAQPRLRELYPSLSHGILLLSRWTGYPPDRAVPAVHPVAGGGYQITRHGEGRLGETATAEEAYALVVAHLPERCGPAVIGTEADL
ncbi:hypothetical protein GPJ59_19440 [Streptomyces bambusae]|uniref:Uncharacterized protein n=2 Tax=Streptomyces bambusae TaxID=1550616 RepID=A0ABS6Z8A5_9ACTN|nr:hypothetical protein [Streptomyces bambusae]